MRGPTASTAPETGRTLDPVWLPAVDGAGRGGEVRFAMAPVLVFAGRMADAETLTTALAEGGMIARPMADATDLARRLEEAGCVVMTQESLDAAAVGTLSRALAAQPAWSELPILVLADRVSDVFALRAALDGGWSGVQTTFLTRPVAPLVLMTAIHAALSARMRQFLLRDQFAQEAELRGELNHRVKNILATVQAMAKMTERSASSDGARFAAFDARLSALAAVHAMLFDTPDGATRFEAVVRVILQPFGMADGEEGRAPRVAIAGPARPILADSTKIMALVIQELVTNALKYGALSTEDGRVDIRLVEEGDRVRFAWRETGGPEVRPPARRGYGTRYVVAALGGLFDGPVEPRYEPEGFSLEVDGPADSILAP